MRQQPRRCSKDRLNLSIVRRKEPGYDILTQAKDDHRGYRAEKADIPQKDAARHKAPRGHDDEPIKIIHLRSGALSQDANEGDHEDIEDYGPKDDLAKAWQIADPKVGVHTIDVSFGGWALVSARSSKQYHD